MVGADLIYNFDLIRPLVDTIALLQPDLTLLATRLRHQDVQDSLAWHAHRAGFSIQTRHREGSEHTWDTVLIFALVKAQPLKEG